MSEETDKRQQRLLEMSEHPEHFTEEEIAAMLHDPDMQDFFRMLSLARRAADHHINDMADIDLEWQQFAATRHQRHQFPRIAAVITGGVLIAGLAVAAVMKLEVLTPSKMESKTVTTQVAKIKTVAKDTVSASPKTQTDTLNVRPKVFDDVPLSRILTDMAAYYHKEWKDDAGAMTDIRLYFVWDRRKSLDENVRMLNNFSRFEITVEGNVIMVR